MHVVNGVYSEDISTTFTWVSRFLLLCIAKPYNKCSSSVLDCFTYPCPTATPIAVGPVWKQGVKTPNREMCPIWHPSGVSFLVLVHSSPGCGTGNGDPGSARKLSRSGEVLEKFSIFIVCLWGVCRWTSLWLQGWKENERKWLKILKYVSMQTGCYW